MAVNRRIALVLAAVVLAVVGGVYWAGSEPGQERPTVTVFAGAGISDALLEVGGAFETQYPCRVRFSFAASSTLARQVVAGATTDVFVSAHAKWMDLLEEKDLILTDTREELLGNRIVCIAPKTAPATTSDIAAWLESVDGRIAMGDPEHVPAGIYGAEALKALGIWDNVHPRLAPAQDTRAALRAVALGECDGGIVYGTDAAASDAVVEVARFDEGLHEPIRFPAALCTECGPWGRTFLDYLHGKTAHAIFERHGFTYLAKGRMEAEAPVVAASGVLSEEERTALFVSLRVAAASVAALLIPGVLVGWLLARYRFPGKSIVEAMTHLPMVVPPVVVGYLLLIILGRKGYLGATLDRLFGLHLGFTLWAAVIASVVMAFPLMVRAVRLAVELVNLDLEEAAMTCGAGPVWRFVSVTLPLASPGILAGVVLAFSRSLGEFGATMTFAGNVPGETQTVPLAIYTSLQRPGGEGSVLRLAVISVLIAMTALWISRHLETRLRNEGASR